MNSLAFPEMFKSTSTQVVSDYDATLSNLKLLLQTDKGELFGDPFYGAKLKSLLYEGNNIILKDLIIDDIYTAIIMFMPQVKVDRKSIIINQTDTGITAKIECINDNKYKNNLYEIDLINNQMI